MFCAAAPAPRPPATTQSGFTVGIALSDVVYGNEPTNMANGAPGGPAEQEPGTKGDHATSLPNVARHLEPCS